jgi:hypothetical protein
MEETDNGTPTRDAKGRDIFPLRITNTTVIYVPKEKCTKEYANWYRENRMGLKVKVL